MSWEAPPHAPAARANIEMTWGSPPPHGSAPVRPSPQTASSGNSSRLSFRAPNGRIFTYAFKPVRQREEHETEGVSPLSVPRVSSDGEHFAGSARKGAKTSFAPGEVVEFASTGELLDDLLKGASIEDNDAAMRSKVRTNTPRVEEEKRNVQITAFLYATKKESDNDFHLLIGGDPSSGDDPRFMTAEVSGTPAPDNASTPAFKAVRAQFKAFFVDHGFQLPGVGHYAVFDTPVPVVITGSIFFDTDHHAGQIGTGDGTIVPATVWEIHPISNIAFP
ncbi:MAG: hypothetical protein NVSMB9_03520 [Isosphaeraceae bacterium]